MLIKNKYNFNWFSYFRCANADEEAFDLMAEAGCTGVFLGIESGSHPVLKAMNKGADPEKYRHGIQSLNDRGIITFCSLVVGFPGETEETVRETFDFVRETKPSYYCLELFFCDLKAPIGKKSAEYGLKGAAYNWKHNTMDWKRATELVEEGYRTIKESVILPLYSFDLWSIAYLMGKGMEKEKIREFLKISSEILVRGFTESNFDITDQEQRAVSIFKK
jgi:p-methyltransferase